MNANLEYKDLKPGKSMSYTIEGNPIPLARHRSSFGHAWDSQKQLKFGVSVQISAQHNNQPLLEGPLRLDVIFFMPMPKRAATSLRGKPHNIRPDLDNLLKLICDCANKIVYPDDAAITIIVAHKQYSTLPRTEFTVTELRVA